MQLTINIPDEVASRVIDAVAANYGYDPASGLTKLQFCRRWMIQQLREATIGYEANIAASSAAISARQRAETDTGGIN